MSALAVLVVVLLVLCSFLVNELSALSGDVSIGGAASFFEGNVSVFGNLVSGNMKWGLASDCVNGSWIAHGLGVTPTYVSPSILSGGYINNTCSYSTPTIIAKNSTHFQLGFYLRHQPIDRLSMVVPVAAGWDSAPTDLVNASDSDWDTSTSVGSGTVVTGIVGNLTWDMGADYGVELRSKTGFWSATFTMQMKWYWSTDGIMFYPTTNTVASQITSTTEAIMFSQIEFTVARYIRLVVEHAGGNSLCYAKFYECQAWDLMNAVLPVDAGNKATIMWSAVYVP